jgi:flagellar assembly protein FliH
VALQELDSNARVRLHAHPAETGFWQRYFAQLQGSGPAPEVLGDAELREGEVKLDTDIGSTHISLETQLKEIEQGFFDLLEQRPRAR